MRLVLAGMLVLSICLTGGCAKFWYQEGKTFTQCRRDLASCYAEASRYSDVDRTSGLGRYESKFVTDCMQTKGYTLVPEKTLPVRVKRESSPVFGIPGVAGTID
ncbi:MAG: hypothetical protein RBR19_02795 [Sedimentisphaerales bacterium]|nr:hypothetical protein [Planctomycetota bacterium]MDY0354780.1 hypothetical protein [Sedimentisphaerales bacterium]NLT78320.1 hypothetical protein [Planctomycetota bacterium]